MRILCVATKSPWPPNDGGRLALWLSLQGLAAAGHEIFLVAPQDADGGERASDALGKVCVPRLVPAARKGWASALPGALWRGQALTVARHRLRALQDAVAECVAQVAPRVLHVEQLQALANCDAARAAGIPIILRMQNVESELWRQLASARLRARPLMVEARRLRANEASAMNAAARVVALTEADAAALRGMLAGPGRAKVSAIAPPFPSRLPAGPAVDGGPAVVLAGSAGWRPNAEGAGWFVREVVPLVAAQLPAARVHVYGGLQDGPLPRCARLAWHPAPEDALTAFPLGAIAVIPLHIGSGIRMRILEAWARGLPVIATPVAAAGLEAVAGRELMIAETPGEFAAAIRLLAHEPARAAALAAAGRRYLETRHDSACSSQALGAVYEAAVRAA